jgi:tRNA-dihydrouridine synthase B
VRAGEGAEPAPTPYPCRVLRIGPLQIPEPALLAPMAGLTDFVFRRVCREQGCGLVYTELIQAENLLAGLHRARRQAETDAEGRPVAVQLYHGDPDVLAEAARWVEEHIDCDVIDLNMGCPVPRVVSKGAGAALMRDPARVERLVRAVTNATALPVTAKIRAGWDEGERNAVAVARAIEAGGGQAIAVHARTRSQGHEGPVDRELLAEVKQAVSVPVIGNGGIRTPEDAIAMRDACGVDAVMVGRASIGHPWIFGAIGEAWAGRAPSPPTPEQRIALVERHLAACIAANQRRARRTRDEKSAIGRAVHWIRGHAVGYLTGAPGGRDAIRQLNDLHTPEAFLSAVREAWLPLAATASGPTRTDPAPGDE